MMSSSLKIYGDTNLPPNVCEELTQLINDSFFKKLDKHFNKIKMKTKRKKRRKRYGKK